MTKTNGISPKLIVAVLTAVVGYLIGQTILDLPPGVVLSLQVALVALGVYSAQPGDVEILSPADPLAPGSVDRAAGDVTAPE